MTTDAVYAVGGTVFLVALFLSVVTTGARVIWYFRHGEPRPRLLTRDVLVKGGLLLSFAPIVGLRIAITDPMDRLEFTTGNVPWALLTIVPGAVGMLVYLYYELAVIRRDTSATSPQADRVAVEA